MKAARRRAQNPERFERFKLKVAQMSIFHAEMRAHLPTLSVDRSYVKGEGQ